MSEQAEAGAAEVEGGDVVGAAIRTAREEDVFRAMEMIEAHGPPLVVVGLYHQIVRALYSREKNIPLMLMIGRAGVQFGLREARAAKDRMSADELKGAAKALSYDLASNSWPGWNDEGIDLTPSDVANGRDLARLNLRLARELKRGDLPLGNACWLIGAHELSSGEHEKAIASFQDAAAHFTRAEKPDFRLMAEGYVAIARLMSNDAKAEGRRQLDAAVSRLKELGTEDAKFFADQLRSVADFFTSRD